MLKNIQIQLKRKRYADLPQSEYILLIEYYASIAKLEQNSFHQHCADYYRAVHLSVIGRLKESNAILHRITPYFEELKHPWFLPAALNCLTTNKIKQGKHEEALRLVKKVLSYKYLSPENTALAKNNQMVFLLMLRAYSKALKKCKEILATLSLKRWEERNLYISSLLDVAEILLLQENDSKCLEVLRKVRNASPHFHAPLLKYKMSKCFGNYYLVAGQYKEAEKHFKLALDIAQSAGLSSELMAVRLLLSESYLKQHKLSQAEYLLLLIFKNFKFENFNYLLQAINSLVSIYQIQGRKAEQDRFEKELAQLVN